MYILCHEHHAHSRECRRVTQRGRRGTWQDNVVWWHICIYCVTNSIRTHVSVDAFLKEGVGGRDMKVQDIVTPWGIHMYLGVSFLCIRVSLSFSYARSLSLSLTHTHTRTCFLWHRYQQTNVFLLTEASSRQQEAILLQWLGMMCGNMHMHICICMYVCVCVCV